MFAVFLPALNFRGDRSPYLWWFYKFLEHFGSNTGFICGQEYFREVNVHAANRRWEVNPATAASLGYGLPSLETLERLTRADIPDTVWETMASAFPTDPLAAFRHLCLDDDVPLRKALDQSLFALESGERSVEAILTCVNCATLQRLCRERNLPLIHYELGPLRGPTWLPTAYFDFSGVNGNTEAAARYAAAGALPAGEWLVPGALRALFLVATLREREPDAELGIGLQIEDDSNVVCYANGHSGPALLRHAMREVADGRVRGPVRVRPHPGSMFRLGPLPAALVRDESPSPLQFLQSCQQLWTINSSLAAEALLLERRAMVCGESPLAFCLQQQDSATAARASAFYFLNYLAPWTLAFSADYVRWRIQRPAETDIRNRHVEGFMKDKIKALEARIAELERQVEERERALARLHTSYSWRLTHPLRLASRFMRKHAAPG